MDNSTDELYTQAALELYPDTFKLIYFGHVSLKEGEGEADLDAVQARYLELQAEYDALQYQRDREYPSIGEQLDQLYWDKKNGTNTWEEGIDAVKAAHPKP